MLEPTVRMTSIVSAMVLLCACGEQTPSVADRTAADVAAIRSLLDRVEQTFEAENLDAAMSVFTDDAAILAADSPDIVGREAIRATYAQMMDQYDIDTRLSTAEIEVAGDLAYERGTYTLKLTEGSSGEVVLDTENRHIHIFKRQPDGTWRTWRMMVNSAAPAGE